MITDMLKYLFFGSKEDLDIFFERAQNLGFAEFISPSETKRVGLPKHLDSIMGALKILREQPKTLDLVVPDDVNPNDISGRILQLGRVLENFIEEQTYIETEISRISPFGDFSLEDIHDIERQTGKHIQFFCMKESQKEKVIFPEDFIYVSTEYDMNYYMSISSHVISPPGFIEMRIESSLNQLLQGLDIVKENIGRTEKELKEKAGYLAFLRKKLMQGLDRYDLKHTKKDAQYHFNEVIFVIEAWIPKTKENKIHLLLEKLAIQAEAIAIEKKDKVPTCMENAGPNRIGEDLVQIYDTPSTKDKDPSGWVIWAFILFFSIIISDAGYGFLYLVLALFLRKKFYRKVKNNIKRMINLLTMISLGCIIWGVFSGAYFGITLSPVNPLNKVSLIDYLAKKKGSYHFEHQDGTYQEWIEQFPELKSAETPDEIYLRGMTDKDGIKNYLIMEDLRINIFLELTLVLGIIHLSLSLVRALKKYLSGIGWVAFLIGGYFYIPSQLGAVTMTHYLGIMEEHASYEIGFQLLIGGLGLAILIGLLQHKLRGLQEFVKIIQIFADILSYLRLYALGLAAMILAATVNELGQKVGFAGGCVILLIGHSINIVLGVMGGVIHGLRLNFIEWYHYSFDGDGRLFNPLKLRFKKQGD